MSCAVIRSSGPTLVATAANQHKGPAIRRSRRSLALIAVLAVALVATGLWLVARNSHVGILPDDADVGRTDPTVPARPVPTFGHVYVIVLENHGLSAILDSAQAPYLASLAAQYGLATNSIAVAHPSQPNYLALFSGNTQGVTDDLSHDIAAPNLADRLEAAGRTWHVFAENVPPGCFTGARASGGRDGSGTYARKHEPAITFTDISSNPTRCANITDFTSFDPLAADYELIIPNLCNDMHDCSVSTGDEWLRGFVPRILASPAWKDGGVLFITFDEGTGSSADGQRVATFVISPLAKHGFSSSQAHTHYSLLRTIDAAWSLDCIDEDCDANTLSEFFTP